MVPDDVIFMVASAFVIFGTFLFMALLFFLMCPQSVLTVEMVKQVSDVYILFLISLSSVRIGGVKQPRIGAGAWHASLLRQRISTLCCEIEQISDQVGCGDLT